MNFWVASAPAPLWAVKVIGKVPLTEAAPFSTPPEKVTPLGSAPDSLMVGAGDPVAVTVNDPAVPLANLALLTEVMVAAAVTPGTAVQVKPLASPALAEKVISVFQLSERAPLVFAHANPASQIPLVSPE